MSETGRILVADDERPIRQILSKNLERCGYDTIQAVDGEEALSLARKHLPDLIILDVMMPALDGFEVCRRLREDFATSRIPILFVTARREEADILRGFRIGGDEYVTKPFSTSQVIARAGAILRRVAQDRDVSPLTGLPGNAALERHIQGLLDREEAFALLYADLDQFKGYNDVYGFDQGDEAILELADALRTAADAATPRPFIGHVGGDDFILVATEENARPIAEAALAGFAARVPPLYSEEDRARGCIVAHDRKGAPVEYPLMTLSIGVAFQSAHPNAPYAQLAAYAAECKKKAKAEEGHSLYCDRRTSPAESSD
jgi:PleD family two-component response regulator